MIVAIAFAEDGMFFDELYKKGGVAFT